MLRVHLRFGLGVDRGGVGLDGFANFIVGDGDDIELSSLLLLKTTAAASSRVGIGGIFTSGVVTFFGREGIADDVVVVIGGGGVMSRLSSLAFLVAATEATSY